MSDEPATDSAPVVDPASAVAPSPAAHPAPAADPLAAYLDTVRVGFVPGASDTARAGALEILRALYAHLARNVAPTAPIVRAPISRPSNPLRGLSIDQALELVIAQLSARVGTGSDAPTSALGLTAGARP